MLIHISILNYSQIYFIKFGMPDYLDGISDFSHYEYEEILISGRVARSNF